MAQQGEYGEQIYKEYLEAAAQRAGMTVDEFKKKAQAFCGGKGFGRDYNNHDQLQPCSSWDGQHDVCRAFAGQGVRNREFGDNQPAKTGDLFGQTIQSGLCDDVTVAQEALSIVKMPSIGSSDRPKLERDGRGIHYIPVKRVLVEDFGGGEKVVDTQRKVWPVSDAM